MNDGKETIKYYCYVRKSSEDKERQALSIPTQTEKTVEQFPDLDIEFIAEEKSAFTPNNRPAFAAMLQRIESGERCGLIAWHPDRLSRNEVDASRITYLIRTGIIKDLKFVTYYFQNSPEGIWMLQMALSQSQYESAKKGRDVQRGMEKKVKLGWRPGIAAQGYLNTPQKELGSRTLAVDSKRFPLLRKMMDLMLTGKFTVPQILALANDEWGYRTPKRKKSGNRPLSRSGIYKIFTNPFYYGWYEWPEKSGHWHKGHHRPVITQDEFNRIQMLLGRQGKPAPHTRSFAFTGLIRCGECGCSVTAEEKSQIICSTCKCKFSAQNKTACLKCGTLIQHMQQPTFLKYVYYHCTKGKLGVKCSQKGIELKELHKQINQFIGTFQITADEMQWAIEQLRMMDRLESESTAALVEAQQREYKAIDLKLQNLLEMRLTSELSGDEYTIKKSALLKEQALYADRLRSATLRQNEWINLATKTFEFAHHAQRWFADAVKIEDQKLQRNIVATLLSNLTLKDKILNIEAIEPLLAIQKFLTGKTSELDTLEPKESPYVTKLKVQFPTVSLRWLPIVNLIRTWYKQQDCNTSIIPQSNFKKSRRLDAA